MKVKRRLVARVSGVSVVHGDATCLPLAASSVDSIVCDPPYLLGFMGKEWDSRKASEHLAWHGAWAAEAFRVLKPGGTMLAFGGSRTQHRLACAIEDAGFEMRDSIAWMYGTGFPKSKQYLKPVYEPIIMARKPLHGTVASNVSRYGTGLLNIDNCRTDGVKGVPASPRRAAQKASYGDLGNDPGTGSGWDVNAGRWPTNLVLTHAYDCADECVEGCPVAELDAQSGVGKSTSGKPRNSKGSGVGWGMTHTGSEYDDTGGASRFFPVFRWQAKAPTRERPTTPDGVQHPTVKPLELMRWLVRLVTPPGGL